VLAWVISHDTTISVTVTHNRVQYQRRQELLA
jgi:hypothetical protein